MNDTLPRWMDLGLLPALNLAMALTVASVVVWAVGLEPLAVMGLLVKGAWGSPSGISYTLYYSTTFVFTGLAVAVAFHAGLFNIGGEGQAAMGGLGTGLVPWRPCSGCRAYRQRCWCRAWCWGPCCSVRRGRQSPPRCRRGAAAMW